MSDRHHEIKYDPEMNDEIVRSMTDDELERLEEEALSIDYLLKALRRSDIATIKTFLQEEIAQARELLPEKEMLRQVARENLPTLNPGPFRSPEQDAQLDRGDIELLELLLRMFDAYYYK